MAPPCMTPSPCGRGKERGMPRCTGTCSLGVQARVQARVQALVATSPVQARVQARVQVLRVTRRVQARVQLLRWKGEAETMSRRTSTARYWDLVKQGRCTQCGQTPCAEGRRSCAVCLQKRADGMQQRREQRRHVGRCPECGGPPLPGAILCPACHRKGRRFWRKRQRRAAFRAQWAAAHMSTSGGVQ